MASQQNVFAQKVTNMYKELLLYSGVQYVQDLSAFVIFNTKDVLFSISYNKISDTYNFIPNETLLSEYKKRKLDATYIPAPETLYSWVNFQYVFYDLFKKQDKDAEHLFNRTLPNTEIVFERGTKFETYKIYAMEQPLYAIGYNKKTNQYGFKREPLMNLLYETLQIPMESKPDYPKLYKHVKDMYLAQCALKNLKDFEIEY